ncbi:MAG: AfsR/SARP family transcriptional regulator [Acidimicrobiales bacterium]
MEKKKGEIQVNDPTVSVEPLRFYILGPLEVRRGAEIIELVGQRQRLLLARLLASVNETVSADQLMHELWGDNIRPGSSATLQAYISELRKLFSPPGSFSSTVAKSSLILTRRPGYQLAVERDQVDSVRFEKMVALVSDAPEPLHPQQVSSLLGDALRLWRGSAFVDVVALGPSDSVLQLAEAHLETLRLWALEERIEADLALGSHGQLTVELQALCSQHLLRERFWGQLMVALYRSGRQAEALRAFQTLRANLDDELGILPSAQLRELEEAMLLQRDDLDWTPVLSFPQIHVTTSLKSSLVVEIPMIDLTSNDYQPQRLNHFPVAMTSFVGRHDEMVGLADSLNQSRLVTLASTGGCGKTRLVLQVATQAIDRWRDGAWFVDLAEVTDPAAVPMVLATALGVHVNQSVRVFESLIETVGNKEMLIIIDNCEQVIDAVAGVVTELLARCPSLQLMCTSREELGVNGEVVWRLDALGLPQCRDDGIFDLDECEVSDAVALFIDRARNVQPNFMLDCNTVGPVSDICHKLEGIPLAIELAVPVLSVLSIDELNARLGDRFRLLKRGQRGRKAHQRTLRAAVDWSYELLDTKERLFFGRVSVLVGPFTLSAAEAVGAGKGLHDSEDVDEYEVLDLLGRLAAKSMLMIAKQEDGVTHYRMLETLRHYGLERLRNSGDEPETRQRHLRYFLRFAEEASCGAHGKEVRFWLPLVEAELSNFRAAIDWAFVNDDLEHALRLAGALRWYFSRLGFLEEGLSWIEPVLERRHELIPELRTLALTSASTIAFLLGRHSMTVELGEEGLAEARGLGDPQELSTALIVRGAAAVFEGNVERAITCFAEGTILCQELGDEWGMAWCQAFWGVGARRMGNLDEALELLEPAIEAFREMGDEQAQILPLVNMGQVLLQQGDTSKAMSLMNEAVRLAYRVGDQILLGTSLVFLGRAARVVDGPLSARPYLLKGLDVCQTAENHVVCAIGVQELAVVALAEGRPHDAVMLAGRAQEFHRSSHGAPTQLEEEELENLLSESRSLLGDDEYQAALDRGATIDLVQVLGVF